MTELFEYIERFGLPVFLVVFFLLRDWMREAAAEKDKKTEVEYRKSLQDMLNKSLMNMNERMILALQHNTTALEGLQGALSTRPCILPTPAKEAAEEVMKSIVSSAEEAAKFQAHKESGQ